MPRRRLYAGAAAKQAAYRRRKQAKASTTARLIALQEEAAQLHVHVRGRQALCAILVDLPDEAVVCLWHFLCWLLTPPPQVRG
jgi:hypothetical protein